MTKQFTRRLVFAACCLLVALCGVRPASAAAPMCDERGASAIAPPPVLPIRDVRLEASVPLGCELPAAAIALGTPSARDTAPLVPDPGVRDAWLGPHAEASAPIGSRRAEPTFSIAAPAPAGYRPSVFRPPRS